MATTPLPPGAPTRRYAGTTGAIIGMHTFGSSAPIKDLLGKFGFTAEKVVEAARDELKKHAKT